MEAERVIKSFGCLPHRNLKLRLSRSRSKSSSGSGTINSPSPRSSTPQSPSQSIPRKSTSSSSAAGRSKEDEYRQVFRRFDNDNDGKISAAELRDYFSSIREYMSYEDAQTIITDLDSDGDNLIDFQDFLRLMERDQEGGSGPGEIDDHQDLKAVFEIFELHKGSGKITPKSLQKVFSRLGDTKSYDECVAMIGVYDTEGKGELHFHEFQQMMTA